MTEPRDRDARLDAVDPNRSVIVQAPAGSGKTTLLVERLLALLARVEEPEEVLAITFTRKAAAEMRERVLRYLDPSFEASNAHEAETLAKAAAIRDKVESWRLLENPQRLLVRTIDSFNHFLARAMPVASALGPVPRPADNTQALYRMAARRVLALVDSDDALAQDIYRLLEWRDHRSQDIEDLLAELLGKREQWLRSLSLTPGLPRAELEAVLQGMVTNQLEETARILDAALTRHGIDARQLYALLEGAAIELDRQDRANPFAPLLGHESMPQPSASELSVWFALAHGLITSGNAPGFRKTVDVRMGFPPRSEMKDDFLAILDALAGETGLLTALRRARDLPTPSYSDEEWDTLSALVAMLRRAAGELELVFARTGQSDYTALAAAALRGLGDEERGYTDLGLYLDRRIRHILVDEFQDTNWAQLHLLEKLTAGWQPDDDRTLFLVGDPMQSIYRFREAEVGLFIRARDFGLGGVRLAPARLSQNFRSKPGVVEWVNARLGPIFPSVEDISAGAVAYAPSHSADTDGGDVELLAFGDDEQEGQAVADAVARALSEHAEASDYRIAVIVRARSHLTEVLPALAERGIRYRAVKLYPLTTRSVVQDLIAITRAVMQPADTAATLAVLRSPVCGLSLADLLQVAQDGTVLDESVVATLHDDAGGRAAPVLRALAAAQAEWRRRPVRLLVEGVWHSLGGPACLLQPATDLRDAAAYLDALAEAEDSGALADWNDFQERLDQTFTEGDPPSDDVRVEILTMHGAKGLEWDMAVLPGLNRPPGPQAQSLLHWLPFTDAAGDEQLLIAPLRASEDAKNPPLAQMILDQQRDRADYEAQRLLYVATTRAKSRLILTAALDTTRSEIKPRRNSLLSHLWATTADDFLATLRGDTQDTRHASPPRDQRLRRVALGYVADIEPRTTWRRPAAPREPSTDIEFNWAGIQARRTGTALHRLLERVGELGVDNLHGDARDRLLAGVPRLLRGLGTHANMLQASASIVRSAFEQTIASELGRWLLSDAHQDCACELAISGVVDGQLVNAIVDRTFVDGDGIRWIIDYKSGYHAGADLDAFFAQEEERYREQLRRYAALFKQLENRPVKAALYLPRHDRLVEVAVDGATEEHM